MGLDMYLTKQTYVKNWDYMGPEERTTITVEGGQGKYIKPERIKEIIEEVGYWRKANQIHQWFVANIQDGNDDCGKYEVSTEQLQSLLDTVNQVLAASELVEGDIRNGTGFKNGKETPITEKGKFIKDSSVAQELLPTQAGFFFGGTDYDQWYYQDLEETKKILEEALKEEGGDFYYHSSW